MRPFPRIAVSLLSLATIAGVFAYQFDGGRWDGGEVIMSVGMPGTSPSGVRWADAFEDAMARWNDATPFSFMVDRSYMDPCAGYRRSITGRGFPAGNGDGRNGVDFRESLCGNVFGDQVLAVTLYYSAPGSLGFSHKIESDIVFNATVDWDIYSGRRRHDAFDFHRVALHELGHVLGLAHEREELAIMAPNYGDIHTLQPDDIAGANALYGVANECLIASLLPHAAVNGRLESGDCRIQDLFGGSRDASYVDIYRLELDTPTTLDIAMRSSEIDPVLIITDARLGSIEIFDDSANSCDAQASIRLPAGEYLLLANTYDRPGLCGDVIGNYSLTITDSGQPLLGSIHNASGAPLTASALITGGASSQGGPYRTRFGADEPIDVVARLAPDPQHVGLDGNIYVLATLSDGRQFMQVDGQGFIRFHGDLDTLKAARTGPLRPLEHIEVVNAQRGNALGLAGQTIRIHVGYALTSSPPDIFYNSTPITLTLTP